MSMSIFQKLTTLGKAGINALLDQGIDAMPIEVLKQHARELEAARDAVADDAAVGEGKVTQLTRQIAANKASIATTNEMIDLLLGDDDLENDSKAEPLAAKVVTLQGQIAALATDLTSATQTSKLLDQNLKQIDARHKEALNRIAMLASQEHSAAAKEQAAAALDRAGRLAGDSTEVSVDDVANRIGERAAIADAKLRRAMGKVVTDDGEAAVVASQAKSLIAERRAALEAKKTVGVTS
mgnify:CR=1 FL=1